MQQMNRRCKLHTLFQSDPYGVDLVNAEWSDSKTSLLSADQIFDMFFDAFEDYFSYYLCNSQCPIVELYMAPFFGILTIIILPLARKVPGFSEFPD